MTRYYIRTDYEGLLRGEYNNMDDAYNIAVGIANANQKAREHNDNTVYIEKIEPGCVPVLFEVEPTYLYTSL